MRERGGGGGEGEELWTKKEKGIVIFLYSSIFGFS